VRQFAAKVRSQPRWRGVDVTEIPATSELYRDITSPRIGFAKISILLIPGGQIIQDPADIFDHLERIQTGPSAVAPEAAQTLVAMLVELFFKRSRSRTGGPSAEGHWRGKACQSGDAAGGWCGVNTGWCWLDSLMEEGSSPASGMVSLGVAG
jgi:hypothetical protein